MEIAHCGILSVVWIFLWYSFASLAAYWNNGIALSAHGTMYAFASH